MCSYLTADRGDLTGSSQGVLIHEGEPALIIQLQLLQGPGAITHLHTQNEPVLSGHLIQCHHKHICHCQRRKNASLKDSPLDSLG